MSSSGLTSYKLKIPNAASYITDMAKETNSIRCIIALKRIDLMQTGYLALIKSMRIEEVKSEFNDMKALLYYINKLYKILENEEYYNNDSLKSTFEKVYFTVYETDRALRRKIDSDTN